MSNNNDPTVFRRKQNINSLVLCILGIAFNLALSLAASALGLPMYLDTIATIAIAVMGGYLPGVTVGFLTNVVKGFFIPYSMYYGVFSVMMAVTATWIYRRGWFKKPVGIVGAICIFAFIGGGIKSLLPWFIQGLSSNSEFLSNIMQSTGYFSPEVAHFLSGFIMELPDKIISVMIVLVILRYVPRKYYQYFEIKGWMQSPEALDGEQPDRQVPVRVLPMQTKILLVVAGSLLTVAITAVTIGMVVYHRTNMDNHTRLAKGTAKIAASVVDGDRIDEYIRMGVKAEGYNETKKHLNEILASSTDIAFIYVYVMEEKGCRVVFDIDTAEVAADEIGSLVAYDKGFEPYIADLLAGKEVEPIVSNEKYGHIMTAYHPIYNSAGKCVCYAAADVDMDLVSTMEKSYLAEIISVFLGFFILICVIVIWMAEFHIIIPINSITKIVDGLSHAGYNQDELDEDVRKIRSLDLHTGDEVEKLYKSVCRMTLNQAEQMRSIRRLTNSTARMQDGLILTMADMVENRDSDTGAHVQKTSAYVKIIAEGLKKKGYYPEKVNDKFISDAIRSAPLHDVGKINIPDSILNKPGKLTDDEYEIMKTHTTAGRAIIDKAIGTMEGDNYLKEARNMATYHHERWDGTGYPEGLHGEVIPLSARIMSVADVFDALTSPRAYKPAYTLEKALSIMEEGRGSQFDPKCIEVFVESIEEVKVVLLKYNKSI